MFRNTPKISFSRRSRRGRKNANPPLWPENKHQNIIVYKERTDKLSLKNLCV